MKVVPIPANQDNYMYLIVDNGNAGGNNPVIVCLLYVFQTFIFC